jgi:hypothetical protein
MMFMGFLTTRPALDYARSAAPHIQVLIYTALVAWPMTMDVFALKTCPTVADKYYALFFGCIKRSSGAMRFSAISYMFFFNFGAILSETVSAFIKKRSVPRLVIAFFSALLFIEALAATPLLLNFDLEWEFFDWNGYRRYPMSPKLVLGWAFISFGALLIATCIVTLKRWLRPICEFLEHLGANVLLYMLISNLTINGFFHNSWFHRNSKGNRAFDYSNRQWEWITIFSGIGQILITRFVIYLAKSGRR